MRVKGALKEGFRIRVQAYSRTLDIHQEYGK
jgi:hypothetical protein